jgi:uncharacterized protein (UPF0264 family)
LNGALGAVSSGDLQEIVSAVDRAAPVSAAFGDAHEADLASRARVACDSGVTYIKVGFAGGRGPGLAGHVREIARAVHPARLVLVAYADFDAAEAPPPDELVTAAEELDVAGMLLDTYDKRGAGLTTLMDAQALGAFVNRAKRPGRMVALAGRLTFEDIDTVRATASDVIGFRGAACDGGRSGDVTCARVRALRDRLKGLRHIG